MFLVELGSGRDPLAQFLARRFARWAAGRRAVPLLSPEVALSLAQRRPGLIRYTVPPQADPRR